MWDKHTQSSFLNNACTPLIQKPEFLDNHVSLNLNNAKVINPIYIPKQGSKVIFFTRKKYLLKRSDQKHINNLLFDVIVCLDIN